MTEEKTKFEIEPVAAPKIPFDFKYITSHWLAIIGMPLGMIPLDWDGFNPQAVWRLELIELEEEAETAPGEEPWTRLTGEFGIRLYPAGGGDPLELDSEQSLVLENVIKKIYREIKGAGGPASMNDMIDLAGKSPKSNSVIVPPWARKQ